MTKTNNKSGIVAGILLPMGLVCLFAFCSLALALYGGSAYKQIQSGVEDSFGPSVTAGYLRQKLSQFNENGGIALRDEDGTQVLVIASQSGDVAYETRIYMKDGRLMENYERADTVFTGMGGVQIAVLTGCEFSLDEDGLFTATIESLDGAVTRASFATAQGGGL